MPTVNPQGNSARIRNIKNLDAPYLPTGTRRSAPPFMLALTRRTGQSGRVQEYGVLQSVLLYRDPPRDRWKYAIYDSLAHYDGWLVGVPSSVTFDEAAAALVKFLDEHWQQPLPGPWEQQQSDWWKAGSGPG